MNLIPPLNSTTLTTSDSKRDEIQTLSLSDAKTWHAMSPDEIKHSQFYKNLSDGALILFGLSSIVGICMMSVGVSVEMYCFVLIEIVLASIICTTAFVTRDIAFKKLIKIEGDWQAKNYGTMRDYRNDSKDLTDLYTLVTQDNFADVYETLCLHRRGGIGTLVKSGLITTKEADEMHDLAQAMDKIYESYNSYIQRIKEQQQHYPISNENWAFLLDQIQNKNIQSIYLSQHPLQKATLASIESRWAQMQPYLHINQANLNADNKL